MTARGGGLANAGPDPTEPYCLSVAAAIRWLQKEDPPELSGDDAVGWWLLIDAGFYPPASVLDAMAGRLERLLKGRSLTSGELYTFTAIARTLARMDYPIPNIGAVHRAWSGSMTRLWPAGGSPSAVTPDHLWTAQMGGDMWPDEVRSRSDLLRTLANSPDPKGLVPANGILLSRLVGLDLESPDALHAAAEISRACETPTDLDATDWELSYLGRAAVVAGQADSWRRVGHTLLGRQKEGAWDSESEEVVESTSLCGLAMVEMGAAELGTIPPSLGRSTIVHRSLLLRDRPTWLRQQLRRVRESSDPNVKGDSLELLVEQWISADSTLRVAGRDVRGGTDEIDIVVEVLSRSPLAPDVEPARFLLVECKNTSESIGARDVRAFRDSLGSRRHESCQLGIFVSHAGFTDDATRLVNEDYGRGKVIVLVSGKEIDRRLAMRQDFSSAIHHVFQDGVLKRP
jgi:Restriction endonuclease